MNLLARELPVEVTMPSLEDRGWSMRPCGHRLVVWPQPAARVTEGGIVIPDATAEREDMSQIEAMVCEVGTGCWADQTDAIRIDSGVDLERAAAWAKPGDHILIAKFAGFYRLGRDGRHYRVISDLDVIAVLD